MPLKIIRRPDTGALVISGTVRPAGAPKGILVRRRAGSDDEALAREEAARLEAEILRTAWHGERPGVRGFAEAALSYLTHDTRTPGTKALVRRLTLYFRDTALGEIGQAAVDKARTAILREGASPATVRRNLIAPLRAILVHASRRGWCARPVFDLPRERKGRTRFLLPSEAEALLTHASAAPRRVFHFLLLTGCRMGEALALDWADVDLRGAKVILHDGETKTGRRRVISLCPAAVALLAGLEHREGRVLRTARGAGYRLSRDGGGQLRTGWATACRKAGLPGEGGTRARSDRSSGAETFRPELRPHDLRHTWATWHYAIHRNLLLLREDGGWADLALPQRYTHLMPEGHEMAIRRFWGMAPVRGGRARQAAGASSRD